MIAMVIGAFEWSAGKPFNGERVLENTVRLFTMIVGTPIALLCFKFGLKALRKDQPDRAWGTLSYGLLLLQPAVARAMNFGQPINWVTTGIYAAGLLCAVIGMLFHARWEKAWWTKNHAQSQENTDE